MQRRRSGAERLEILEQISRESSEDKDLNLYIIVINGLTQNITIKWLLQLLQKSSPESGGHFILSRIQDIDESDSDVTLHASASNTWLNVSADAIGLKQLKTNEWLCQVFRQSDHLLDSDDCLTISERQRVLLYQLESLHSIERGLAHH